MVPHLESRADELSDLLRSVEVLVHNFIDSAETKQDGDEGKFHSSDEKNARTSLVEHHPPEELRVLLGLDLPDQPGGKDAVLDVIGRVLKYSVNTWHQGFMDKLYGSTNAIGVIAEFILAVLNTNVHVYQVSPVLTLVEKYTARTLANAFGLNGPHSGGISQPGGSASNQTSIIIARNTLYPSTKTEGNGSHRFVLFTSEHGHYSLEKAAQMFGIGSEAVWSVPVDEFGAMLPTELESLIEKAKSEGRTPFYVNATAGTTVLGSFDPFNSIADVCRKHGLWLHADASWGGGVVMSDRLRQGRLEGIERADSIAVNPHKMLGAPMTCSFLLGQDLRQFHRANTLPAGYLFHNNNPDAEVFDLADLTPQCGRRGDSLKLFLGWTYYGRDGYAKMVENAFDTAQYLFDLLAKHQNFVLVSKSPLPCLQVCFYWAKDKRLSTQAKSNSFITQTVAQKLLSNGFMIDYAPGPNGQFFRVVVSLQTQKATTENLVRTIDELAETVSG